MPNVVVQTIVSETMNAPAAAYAGVQRAVIHSMIGNSRATGSIVSHDSGGSEMIMMVIAASADSAAMPSTTLLRGGGVRKASATPITSGATVMMPTASDASQCRQVVQIDVVGLWNNLKATIPPTP